MPLSPDCLPHIPQLALFDAEAARRTQPHQGTETERLLNRTMIAVYRDLILMGRNYTEVPLTQTMDRVAEVARFFYNLGFVAAYSMPGEKYALSISLPKDAGPIVAAPTGQYPEMREISARGILAWREKLGRAWINLDGSEEGILLWVWLAALDGRTSYPIIAKMEALAPCHLVDRRGFCIDSTTRPGCAIITWSQEPVRPPCGRRRDPAGYTRARVH